MSDGTFDRVFCLLLGVWLLPATLLCVAGFFFLDDAAVLAEIAAAAACCVVGMLLTGAALALFRGDRT